MERKIDLTVTTGMPFMLHFQEKSAEYVLADGEYDDELQIWVPRSSENAVYMEMASEESVISKEKTTTFVTYGTSTRETTQMPGGKSDVSPDTDFEDKIVSD